MSNPHDETPETCWCHRELDDDGQCPVHGDPRQSAKEERADYLRERDEDR